MGVRTVGQGLGGIRLNVRQWNGVCVTYFFDVVSPFDCRVVPRDLDLEHSRRAHVCRQLGGALSTTAADTCTQPSWNDHTYSYLHTAIIKRSYIFIPAHSRHQTIIHIHTCTQPSSNDHTYSFKTGQQSA